MCKKNKFLPPENKNFAYSREVFTNDVIGELFAMPTVKRASFSHVTRSCIDHRCFCLGEENTKINNFRNDRIINVITKIKTQNM